MQPFAAFIASVIMGNTQGIIETADAAVQVIVVDGFTPPTHYLFPDMKTADIVVEILRLKSYSRSLLMNQTANYDRLLASVCGEC